MKLYSKGQVILYSVISSLLAASLAGILFIMAFPKKNMVVQNDRNNEAPGETLDQYNRSPVLYDKGYQPGKDQTLSQDENENIDIYRELNHAVVNITTIIYSYNY